MSRKKKVLILIVIAVAVLAVVFLIRKLSGGGETDPENTAYVTKVSDLVDGGLGTNNRYSGVVESQDTWSVAQNPDSTVKEVLVQTGDEVKKGTPLFSYDTEKYQSDLDQANIDLQRLKNDLDTINDTVAQLQKQQKKASAADQANYTIQIQQQQLDAEQKKLDIQSKENDIKKLQDNIENATVKSEIDGVVKSINDGTTSSDSSSVSPGGSGDGSSFITIMKTGDLRVKGTVSEQNIGMLSQDEAVIVYSRVNDQTWKGTISKIDTDNALQSTNYYGGDSSNAASKYAFYVELADSDGLMMGQHVYVEPDYGQEDRKDGLWIPTYMIDETDPDHPFVWKDDNGKLKKQEVKTGETDEDLYETQILDGLEMTDAIAQPDDSLKEGMRTAPESERPAEDYTSDSAGMPADGTSYDGAEMPVESMSYEDSEMPAEDTEYDESGIPADDGYNGVSEMTDDGTAETAGVG